MEVKKLSFQACCIQKTSWGKTDWLNFGWNFYSFIYLVYEILFCLLSYPIIIPIFWIFCKCLLQRLLYCRLSLQIAIIYTSFHFQIYLPTLIRITTSKKVLIKINKKKTHLFRFCCGHSEYVNTCKIFSKYSSLYNSLGASSAFYSHLVHLVLLIQIKLLHFSSQVLLGMSPYHYQYFW